MLRKFDALRATMPTKRSSRGATLVEFAAVLVIVAGVLMGSVSMLGGDVATTFGAANDMEGRDLPGGPDPEGGAAEPILLERWVFDATCNGWWNAEWTGSGCDAEGNPKRIESPLVETPGGGLINVVVEGNEDGGPTNLVIKLVEYSGMSEIGQTNVGTLSAGDGLVDGDIGLSNSTDRVKITATGPGELQVVEIWLNP